MRLSLFAVLAIELPFLIVSFALLTWALGAFVDAVRFQDLSGTRKGFESGDYGFNYGTQVVTLTNTFTALSGTTPIATPRVVTYTLYPYVQGTIAYTSIYSRIGYVPPAVTSFSPTTFTSTRTSDGRTFLTTASIAQRDVSGASPTPTAAPVTSPHAKRSWVDERDGGLYGGDGEGGSFFGVMILCIALVVAFQAIRLCATSVYMAIAMRSHDNEKAQRGALIMTVTVTTLAWLAITAAGLAAFVMFGHWYPDLLSSPGALTTLVFYAINIITTFIVLVWSCVALHRIKSRLMRTAGYHQKAEEGTTPSRKSQASGV
jgi:hypothetical protein